VNTASAISTGRIAVLMPEVTDPVEIEVRERLLMARDIASRELARSWNETGAPLLVLIAEIGGAWAFQNATINQLRHARQICLNLMQLIPAIEQLESCT